MNSTDYIHMLGLGGMIIGLVSGLLLRFVLFLLGELDDPLPSS